MESRYDAIVIGLGPVGSFMALKLEQQGMKVLAIDKEKDIYPLPRAVSTVSYTHLTLPTKA